MAYPHLPKAPIREAVVDIRCQLPDTFSSNDLLALHDEIIGQYPEKKVIRRFEGGFQMEHDTIEAKTTHFGIDGYQFLKDDSLQVVQFRLDGFTFSRLFPYTRWESVRDEAKRLWEIYRQKTAPTTVSRVALRYINDLVFPLGSDGWEKWLTAPPKAPPSIKTRPSHFLTQCQIDDVETKTTWRITQAVHSEDLPAKQSVILDIDVFKSGNFEEDDSVWEIMEILRDIKNRIFFDSVTEKSLELFR